MHAFNHKSPTRTRAHLAPLFSISIFLFFMSSVPILIFVARFTVFFFVRFFVGEVFRLVEAGVNVDIAGRGSGLGTGRIQKRKLKSLAMGTSGSGASPTPLQQSFSPPALKAMVTTLPTLEVALAASILAQISLARGEFTKRQDNADENKDSGWPQVRFGPVGNISTCEPAHIQWWIMGKGEPVFLWTTRVTTHSANDVWRIAAVDPIVKGLDEVSETQYSFDWVLVDVPPGEYIMRITSVEDPSRPPIFSDSFHVQAGESTSCVQANYRQSPNYPQPSSLSYSFPLLTPTASSLPPSPSSPIRIQTSHRSMPPSKITGLSFGLVISVLMSILLGVYYATRKRKPSRLVHGGIRQDATDSFDAIPFIDETTQYPSLVWLTKEPETSRESDGGPSQQPIAEQDQELGLSQLQVNQARQPELMAEVFRSEILPVPVALPPPSYHSFNPRHHI
ncbi:hypothetical protein BKA70DRAFT_1563331 [Coprinopsis sp. MPI-PUGE-AT-0042]|nr:hypothetical protein BKA70DRAFT_1563331 [Coprinopsis sp. MPI-PUGE-AT-0042]